MSKYRARPGLSEVEKKKEERKKKGKEIFEAAKDSAGSEISDERIKVLRAEIAELGKKKEDADAQKKLARLIDELRRANMDVERKMNNFKSDSSLAKLLSTDLGKDCINEPDTYGVTPLHAAASYCRLEAVKLLVEMGADVNAENAMRRTPIDLASQYIVTSATAPSSVQKYQNIVDYLGSKGVRPSFLSPSSSPTKFAQGSRQEIAIGT